MRSAVAGLVLGLALAVAVPAAWALTRPPAAAGPPIARTLAGGASATAAPPPPAGPAAVSQPPAPVQLQVPALGTDAPVVPVGVGPDGRMALPPDVRLVGWYRFGPAPGAPGSAVLAGHVDDPEQGLGALASLRRAEAGHQVLVRDSAGDTRRWRVVSRELIGKPALPADEVFRRDGPPRLTLITCGGPFLAETGSYRDNVVVVAEPAP